MIHCEQCEHFRRSESGEISFSCDPFGAIKEPECLLKWQMIKINQMVAGYQATLEYYHKLAPLQEKMFKVMERELDDINESEKWKADDPDGEADDPDGEADDEESPEWDRREPLK